MSCLGETQACFVVMKCCYMSSLHALPCPVPRPALNPILFHQCYVLSHSINSVKTVLLLQVALVEVSAARLPALEAEVVAGEQQAAEWLAQVKPMKNRAVQPHDSD